jgi:hypothetical protein
MNQAQQLREAAQQCINFRIGNMGNYSEQVVKLMNIRQAFQSLSSPERVLGLLNEIDSLRAALLEASAQREQPAASDVDWKAECQRVQALFEKETLRASELHEQLRQVTEHRDHCLRVVDKLKAAEQPASKPNCKECEDHRRTQQANKEWREDVARGREIINGLAASNPDPQAQAGEPDYRRITSTNQPGEPS